MRKLVISLILVAIAAPVTAQPIYFECSMSDAGSKAGRWEVTYDEESGSLTWDSVGGRNGHMTAVTDGSLITGTEVMASDLRDTFRIDRATGHATSAFQVGNKPISSSTGNCKAVAQLPKFPHEQFRAAEYEFVAHFIALIQSHRLVDANQMLTAKPNISTWNDDNGARRTLVEFASYITQCPVHDFEGNNTRAAHNLNVTLDCPGHVGASLELKDRKISSITYGDPPIIRTVAIPKR